jgi:mercuric reductase
MTKYDLIIIGGGAGAFAAAIKANELKKKTAIINGGLPAGGTCVNVGCVPSKVLLHAGEVLHMAKNHGVPGIELEVKSFDFNKVIEDELNMVEGFRNEKYEKVLKNLEHVTYIEGKSSFSDEKEVEVNGEKLSAEKFIIATGSTANVPPIEGIKEVGYVTHIEALKLKEQPKELAIIGAGPVGLEFAQMYSRFGTKVTILQSRERIFPHGEAELITRLAELLEKEGVTIKTNVEVKNARSENGKKVLSYITDGKGEEIAVDEILLAAGKTANTESLNLDIPDVEVNERKAVVVNNNFETNVPYIYSVGDVTNLPLRLETTAGHEGTLVALNALNEEKNSIDYDTVPYAIFTDPGYASVGLTEDAQMERDGVCACRTVPFEVIPKAGMTRRTEGLIKMGMHPKTQVILGVHILSPNAADLIAQAMVLVKNKNTIDDVLNSEPVFPTMSEAIKYVALSFTKDLSQLSCCI